MLTLCHHRYCYSDVALIDAEETMPLYSVRSTGVLSCRMVKFDEDWNVQSIYYLYRKSYLTYWNCDCFQANAHVCVHRNIVGLFYSESKIDTGWLYDSINHRWERPFNDPVRIMRQRRAK